MKAHRLGAMFHNAEWTPRQALCFAAGVNPDHLDSLQAGTFDAVAGFDVARAIKEVRAAEAINCGPIRSLIVATIGQSAWRDYGDEPKAVAEWLALFEECKLALPPEFAELKKAEQVTILPSVSEGVSARELTEAFGLDDSWKETFKRLRPRSGLKDAITHHGEAPRPHLFNPVKVAKIISVRNGKNPKALLATIKRHFPEWQDEAEIELSID